MTEKITEKSKRQKFAGDSFGEGVVKRSKIASEKKICQQF